MNFSNAIVPQQTKEEMKNFFPAMPEPFVMPEAAGEQLFDYVTTIKQESQIEYCTVAGISFQKYLISPDASLIDSKNKRFFPVIPVKKFTERQAAALMARIKKEEFVIAAHRNLKAGKDEKEEFFPRTKVSLAEHVVFCKTEDYIKMQLPQAVIPEIKSEPEGNLRDEIYKVQAADLPGDPPKKTKKA